MISSFSPYFMKSSFDLVDRPRKKKRPKQPPSLFTQFFKRMNHMDRTSIEDEFYQEAKERTLLAEKLDPLRFKKKERVMNNLLYEKEITLETLSVLCTYYKCPMVYMKDKTYVKMGPEGEPLFMSNHHFVDSVDLTQYLEISLDKPLKSVSYYCLPDLRDMATKLLLPTEKYKKQVLYDSIKLVLMKLYKIEE